MYVIAARTRSAHTVERTAPALAVDDRVRGENVMKNSLSGGNS